MYLQSTKVHQKLISFPEPLFGQLQKKIKKCGVSFSEYIRFLAINDIQEKDEEIEILDEETSKRVAASMEDFKKGRFVTLRTKKEISDYFNNL